MKFLNKFLLVAGFFSLAGVVASDIEADWEVIEDTTKPITFEITQKAGTGFKWNFELLNKDAQKIYVSLDYDKMQILPDFVPDRIRKDYNDSFYILRKGEVIRIAGLDMTKPISLLVLTENDYEVGKHLFMLLRKASDESEFYKFMDDQKRLGRSFSDLKIGIDKTLFLVFEDGKLKPVPYTSRRLRTESGLSLDRNIQKLGK